MLLKSRIVILFLLTAVQAALAGPAFVHPGLLESREDLARIKEAVAAKEEPMYSGYEIFRTNAQSELNYKMRGPLAMVGRNPTVGQTDYDSDADAAYQLAIMWCITGNRAYAEKSKGIVDAWSATLTNITGRDAVLMAGLGPFKMINAAEILRYTDAGWSREEIQRTEKHFREVVYPVIKNFAPFANGNWDTACIKTMMAIGVFCDDRAMFERALRYYLDGSGDGRLTHYIINGTGQCQESGRDQQHTQLGLAHLGDCCEIAWHQGLNLYGYDDNLLLKGFEYTAEYNLGEDVPFQKTTDETGKYHHAAISTKGRGRFRAVWEEIYNAYAVRLGIPAPFAKQVVEKIRPEGIGVPTAPNGADHPGFGTLLFARAIAHPKPARTRAEPAAPAGIIANGFKRAIELAWIAPLGANGYIVKRAAKNGNYNIVANCVKTPTYTDSKVEPDEVYSYVVTAVNSIGESSDSYPASIGAGLPKPWRHQGIGTSPKIGNAHFDGNVFTLRGAGAGLGGTNDQFEFVFRPLDDDGVISAQFVPQSSSQFSQFGLMLRESNAADAANVSLLISPQMGRDVEAPYWRAELSVRKAPGTDSVLCAASDNFSEPIVTFGRLAHPCWLKLERSGKVFTGYVSSDGQAWTAVGTATNSLKQKLLAGLAVCSRISNVSTTISFDHVNLVGNK